MVNHLTSHQISLQWFTISPRIKLKVLQWLIMSLWSTLLLIFTSWNTTALFPAILLILVCGGHTLLKRFPKHVFPALHWTILSASNVYSNFTFLIKLILALYLILQLAPTPPLPVHLSILYFSFFKFTYYLLAYHIKYLFVKFITYYLVPLLEYKLYKDG